MSINDTAVSSTGMSGETSCGPLTFIVNSGGKDLWTSQAVRNQAGLPDQLARVSCVRVQSDTQTVSVDLTGSSYVTLKACDRA